MRRPFGFMLVASIFLLLMLGACSNDGKGQSEMFTLKDHDNQEVTVIRETPTILFFFTTYT